MTHWTFVTMAYVLALGGTAGLVVWNWLAMRSTESRAEAVKRR